MSQSPSQPTKPTWAKFKHRHEQPDDLERELGKLDSHIADDHGDPHKAALEDTTRRPMTRSTWAAIFFLGFTFQPALCFSILTIFPILVPISLSVQGSLEHVNWMASGWSLAGAISFGVAGQVSDIFGRRHVLLAGQALLILGYIVGATAHSMGQLIASMVILGLGTGCAFVLIPGISELVPNRYRSIGVAWTECNSVPFNMFGPLLARALLQHATWRWIFYLGIITGVICLVGTAMFYHAPNRPIHDRSKLQLLGELDYLGLFLFSAGYALLLFGISAGGSTYPWDSATVIAPMIIGALLLVATFVWDFWGPVKRPIFPYRLFSKIREYTLLLVLMFVAGLVYLSITALIPEQIGYVWTSDPTRAGLYNIPAGFGCSLGGVVLGGLVFKIKHIHLQLLVAIVIQTIFTAAMAAITPDRVAMGIVFQALANLPFAWVTIIAYVTASLHVPHRDLGLALGLLGSFRFLGGAVGTTVLSTILNNKVAVTLPDRVIDAVVPLGVSLQQVPALLGALASENQTAIAALPSNVVAAALEAEKWGWNDAFKITWLATIPFGVIGCIAAVFVADPSPYFTRHTSVTLTKDRLGGRTVHRGEGTIEKTAIGHISEHVEGGGGERQDSKMPGVASG